MSARKLNRDDVLFWLQEARGHIDRLIEAVAAGEFDDYGSIALGHNFDSVLAPLCRAWHVRDLTATQLKSVSSGAIIDSGYSVPNFNNQLRLVDPGSSLF